MLVCRAAAAAPAPAPEGFQVRIGNVTFGITLNAEAAADPLAALLEHTHLAITAKNCDTKRVRDNCMLLRVLRLRPQASTR